MVISEFIKISQKSRIQCRHCFPLWRPLLHCIVLLLSICKAPLVEWIVHRDIKVDPRKHLSHEVSISYRLCLVMLWIPKKWSHVDLLCILQATGRFFSVKICEVLRPYVFAISRKALLVSLAFLMEPNPSSYLYRYCLLPLLFCLYSRLNEFKVATFWWK